MHDLSLRGASFATNRTKFVRAISNFNEEDCFAKTARNDREIRDDSRTTDFDVENQ